MQSIYFSSKNLDATHFYEIPSAKTFESIRVTYHDYDSEIFDCPTMAFVRTDQSKPEQISEVVYTEPYNFEILQKRDKNVIRLFVPSIYYKNGNKITTESISFEIIYNEQKYQTMSWEPADPDYDYVIITNETFYPIYKSFGQWKVNTDSRFDSYLVLNVSDIYGNSTFFVNSTFGDATNQAGGNPWISDGDEITSNYNMFNDTQAQIRNCIRYYSYQHETVFFLLGGNKDVVPPRMVCSYAWSGSSWDNDTSHASDMYYSNLHNNMNNNTNSRWMENKCFLSGWDDIDWGYDVFVGRVLVDDKPETWYWINKTKAYVNNATTHGNYLRNIIIACKNVGNSISNQSWYDLGDEYSASLCDEFSSNQTFVNNKNISQAQWSVMDDYCEGTISGFDGIHIILHEGHGGTLWTPYDVNLVNNNTPNFVYTEGCNTGSFGSGTSSNMERWCNHWGNIMAGIANSAYGWFGASTYYVERMMREMFNTTVGNFTRMFCKAHNDAREDFGHPEDSVFGMIVKETNFIGDPSLQYQWHTQLYPEIISINNQSNQSTIYTPNPTFKWYTVLNTAQYHLQIANDSIFTDLVVNLSNITSFNFPLYYSENITTVTFTLPLKYELLWSKTYYCRVRGYTK